MVITDVTRRKPASSCPGQQLEPYHSLYISCIDWGGGGVCFFRLQPIYY